MSTQHASDGKPDLVGDLLDEIHRNCLRNKEFDSLTHPRILVVEAVRSWAFVSRLWRHLCEASKQLIRRGLFDRIDHPPASEYPPGTSSPCPARGAMPAGVQQRQDRSPPPHQVLVQHLVPVGACAELSG